MARTKVSSVRATSLTAGAGGPSKSKTPCYFFAQGYCAKRDQCPYMHDQPAAQKNHVGVDGKAALHASGGRPSVLLKQRSSGLRFKRLISGTEKETLAFMGPKSLAQIKAEKLAGGDTGFKAIEKLDSGSTIVEAEPNLLGRMSAVFAESANVTAAEEEKAVSSHMKLVATTTKQDDARKHEVVTAEGFEGPKSLRKQLKRKRDDAESGNSVKKSLLGISEAKSVIGKLDSSSTIVEAEPKLLGRMSAVSAESANVSAAEEKVRSSHMNLVSTTTKQEDALKHEAVTAEGPKSLRKQLKRKRDDAESGNSVKKRRLLGICEPKGEPMPVEAAKSSNDADLEMVMMMMMRLTLQKSSCAWFLAKLISPGVI